MFDFSHQKALPLKLRPSFGRHDFIVGDSNNEAVNWIDKFPMWKQDGLVLVGPNSSGKSHLVSVLKSKEGLKILEASDINKEKIDILKLKNLVIENIEKIYNHNFLLHIINLLKENKHKIILTSRKTINEMNIELEDLRSRLLVFPQAKILLPTDDVLKGIMIKLSKDKGITLDNLVINFILNHIERSYKAINMFINKLDKISLNKKKKITIPFIKEMMNKP